MSAFKGADAAVVLPRPSSPAVASGPSPASPGDTSYKWCVAAGENDTIERRGLLPPDNAELTTGAMIRAGRWGRVLEASAAAASAADGDGSADAAAALLWPVIDLGKAVLAGCCFVNTPKASPCTCKKNIQ